MQYQSRKLLRLPDYNYSSQGVYFVTFCTYDRQCILSNTVGDDNSGMTLTRLGALLEETITELTDKNGFHILTFVIMPDHIHMLVSIPDEKNAVTVGRYIGEVKSLTAKKWREECSKMGIISGKLWQRGFYDHIIRNEQDLHEKWNYIIGNPGAWIERNISKRYGD